MPVFKREKDMSKLEKVKRRIYQIIEVGYSEDEVSRIYDIVGVLAIVLNLAATIAQTYDDINLKYYAMLHVTEAVTVFYFALDYVLRIWTAHYSHPNDSRTKGILKYAFSFTGIIDLLSFLPYYLPFFFPGGAIAFRMFRIVRVFRLFRINAYYDALNVIAAVIKSKAQQLLSSVFIIVVMMIASSLAMYSLEHDAQPEVFANAFSGVWWAASTLATVGYGDIYPITTAGKILGIIITFLGVGVVAVPTGIISAGFVEQYARLKAISEQAVETDIHFIKLLLNDSDHWAGRKVADLRLPREIILAAIQREKDIIIPRGNVVLKGGDVIVLGAESFKDNWNLSLKEVELKDSHPWNGQTISQLDISRQTFIVLVKRGDKTIIPRGDLRLKAGDVVVLYTKMHIQDANEVLI